MEEIFGSEERGSMKMRDERIEREWEEKKRMTEDKNERKYVG